jgi:hypothetical protein
MEVSMLHETRWSTLTDASKAIMRHGFAGICLLGSIFFKTAVVLLLTWAAFAESTPYHYNGQRHFDVKRVPFSRFGSYLSISDLSDFPPPLTAKLYLRTMHEGGRNQFQL